MLIYFISAVGTSNKWAWPRVSFHDAISDAGYAAACNVSLCTT